MKIAVLSRKESLYSTRRLVEAAESRGHEAVVIDYLRCYLNIAGKRPVVLLDGQPLDDVGGVIPRIGASHTVYGAAVVRQFQMLGVPCLNGAAAIARSRDKLQCTQLLAQQGVALPATGFGHSFKDVTGVIDSLGGPPLVVKTLSGTQGIGVVLAENLAAAQSVISAFRSVNANILVQEFVREAGGADMRCFVVGGKVVAAMRRQAAAGEFRANLHRGATAKAIELSPAERRLAVKAARIVGLGVAGVDLLPTASGPVVLEVNSSPGLEGIEAATGVDVADCIIRRLERKAAGRAALIGAV